MPDFSDMTDADLFSAYDALTTDLAGEPSDYSSAPFNVAQRNAILITAELDRRGVAWAYDGLSIRSA